MRKMLISKKVFLALSFSFYWVPYEVVADITVLNTRGKPGRDVLELMGDSKTEDFGRPLVDSINSDAVISGVRPGKRDDELGRYIHFTGDSCGNLDIACYAMVYYKSYHGYIDLSDYDRLVFDVSVDQSPTAALSVRIGSYPSRSEIEISDMLPSAGKGYRTVEITMEQFMENSFEGFNPKCTEDALSFGTTGTAEITISNVRWLK